jgi:hypothetical protein
MLRLAMRPMLAYCLPCSDCHQAMCMVVYNSVELALFLFIFGTQRSNFTSRRTVQVQTNAAPLQRRSKEKKKKPPLLETIHLTDTNQNNSHPFHTHPLPMANGLEIAPCSVKTSQSLLGSVRIFLNERHSLGPVTTTVI